MVPATKIEIHRDLDRIDYAAWVEQQRAWFRRQFSWVFEIQEALSREGFEVDYPTLLVQSGEIWRFAYPRAQVGRQIEPDPNGMLKVAVCCGRDEQWLREQTLPSLGAAVQGPRMTPAKAFEQWINAVVAWTRPSSHVDSMTLWDVADTCLYLANTRTLIILAIRNDREAATGGTQNEILPLLEDEIRTLSQCAALLHGLNQAALHEGLCVDGSKCEALIAGIRRIGELEEQMSKRRPTPDP